MRIADDELWNLVSGAIWRFRRRYTRQNRIERYLIQRLCGRRAKKTNPASFSPMPEQQNTTKEVGNVMDQPRHACVLHVEEIGGTTSRNGEISQLSAGKLNCQRSRDD